MAADPTTENAPAPVDPGHHRHRGLGRRLENAAMSLVVRAGAVPHCYLLTTRGRRTGRQRRVPVVLLEAHGRRWLVAPYGPVGWVHNARTAGQVTLTRRRSSAAYAVRELSGAEAGPVLQRYAQIARAARRSFAARPEDPVDRFVVEAGRHPVFELTPVDADD